MSFVPSAALAYNLYLKHDLHRVAEAFEAAKIPWMLIKGVALAESVYGGIANRPMVDNDIVVLPPWVEQAHQVLVGLGFYDRPGNQLVLNRQADFEHPMHYPHSEVHTGLELHWHIYAPELFRGGVEPFFERAIVRTLAGIPVLTLNNEDRLVQLATHWAQHGLSKPTILLDIAKVWNCQYLAEHVIDLSALVRRLDEVGATHVLALALEILEQRDQLLHPIPKRLQTRRASGFGRLFRERISEVDGSEAGSLTEAKEHQLRLLSWSLLAPSRIVRSMQRELLPSPARLSRIAGRPLSGRESVALFLSRQVNALSKIRR